MYKPQPIWPTPEQLSTLAVVQDFRPRYLWDDAKKKFTTTQMTTPQGQPVWQSSAFLLMGWEARRIEVPILVAGECPSIGPNPAALLQAFGIQDAGSHLPPRPDHHRGEGA